MHPARAATITAGPRAAARLRLVGAWLLVVALLFGQGVGTVHSITHGTPGGHAHAHAHEHGHGHGPASAAAEHGLQALFDHDPEEPACRLYDQLLLADLWLPAAPVLAPTADAQPALPAAAAVRVAARAAAYLARGPPRG